MPDLTGTTVQHEKSNPSQAPSHVQFKTYLTYLEVDLGVQNQTTSDHVRVGEPLPKGSVIIAIHTHASAALATRYKFGTSSDDDAFGVMGANFTADGETHLVVSAPLTAETQVLAEYNANLNRSNNNYVRIAMLWGYVG